MFLITIKYKTRKSRAFLKKTKTKMKINFVDFTFEKPTDRFESVFLYLITLTRGTRVLAVDYMCHSAFTPTEDQILKSMSNKELRTILSDDEIKEVIK
jgi:hypothetical protein